MLSTIKNKLQTNKQKRHTCTHQIKHTRKINRLTKQNTSINTSALSLAKAQYCTIVRLQTNKSLFLLLYLHKIYASRDPSLCPLCNIHVNNTTYLLAYTHVPNL